MEEKKDKYGLTNAPKLFSMLEYIRREIRPDESEEGRREAVFQSLKNCKHKPCYSEAYLEYLSSDFSVDPKTIPGGKRRAGGYS